MALDHQKRGRARRSFRDAAWWRAPIDIRNSLTEPPPDDREMLGHPERNRAEPLGFSGKPDVGEPFEQDPNRDLTMEATDPTKPDRMERLDLGADRDDTVDRRHGPSARRPSPAQSKTDGSTGTVGLDWPRRFGPRRCDQLDRALVRLATHGRLIAESRSDA